MPKALQPTAQLTLVPGDVSALATAIVSFKAHAALAAAMVAKLDTLIDRCAAIPTAEWQRWVAAQALYNNLRRGTVPSPLAPHVWPWRTDLRTVQVDAFPLLIRVRDAYGKLDGVGKIAATQRFGTLHNGGQDFTPIWAVGGWPTQALRDLDTKAATVKLDIVPLMTTNGALWAGAGYEDAEVIHKQRGRRKQLVGVRWGTGRAARTGG